MHCECKNPNIEFLEEEDNSDAIEDDNDDESFHIHEESDGEDDDENGGFITEEEVFAFNYKPGVDPFPDDVCDYNNIRQIVTFLRMENERLSKKVEELEALHHGKKSRNRDSFAKPVSDRLIKFLKDDKSKKTYLVSELSKKCMDWYNSPQVKAEIAQSGKKCLSFGATERWIGKQLRDHNLMHKMTSKYISDKKASKAAESKKCNSKGENKKGKGTRKSP